MRIRAAGRPRSGQDEVALLDAGDRDHEICVATLASLRDPLVTVWPAFTEAMYLLRDWWPAQRALWSRLETAALTLPPLDGTVAPVPWELAKANCETAGGTVYEAGQCVDTTAGGAADQL